MPGAKEPRERRACMSSSALHLGCCGGSSCASVYATGLSIGETNDRGAVSFDEGQTVRNFLSRWSTNDWCLGVMPGGGKAMPGYMLGLFWRRGQDGLEALRLALICLSMCEPGFPLG